MKETSDFALSLISVVSQSMFLTCLITILKLKRTILILPSCSLHHTSPPSHTKNLLQHICMYVVYNMEIFLVKLTYTFVFPMIFHICYFQCQNFFLSRILHCTRYNGTFLTYGYQASACQIIKTKVLFHSIIAVSIFTPASQIKGVLSSLRSMYFIFLFC